MPLQGLEDILPSHDPVARLVEWLRATFEAEHGIDLGQDSSALQRLNDAARQAADELATAASTTIHLPFITSTPTGPLHLSATATRAQLGT